MNLLELPVIDKTDGTVNTSICTDCGGKCCQKCPGIARPDDFGPVETLQATLESYLRTGFWAVDWWEGDPRENGDLSCVRYIRPAIVGHKGETRHPAWGGTCILWSSDNGCSLPFNRRPYECRNLIPAAGGRENCHGINKKETVLTWTPFQSQIVAAMEAVERERGQ